VIWGAGGGYAGAGGGMGQRETRLPHDYELLHFFKNMVFVNTNGKKHAGRLAWDGGGAGEGGWLGPGQNFGDQTTRDPTRTGGNL